MRKVIFTILALLFISNMPIFVSAAQRREKEVPEENFAYTETDDNYWVKFVATHPDYIHEFIAGKKLGDYSISGLLKYDKEIITNNIKWLNPEQIIIPGMQTVQIKAEFDDQELILTGEIEGIVKEEFGTVPSLTATRVHLLSDMSYDINLNNKVAGSKYKWTSSNPSVAKVNVKNGLVTAVSEGEAIITCEITLPDGTIQTLKSIVTVGYDENAPVLTDTQLDLEIGDKYDINVENKIAKSKYRWVSSDRNVVKVNSSNGKVTAVGSGVAYITCTITTPENQVIVLRCDITVTEPAE